MNLEENINHIGYKRKDMAINHLQSFNSLFTAKKKKGLIDLMLKNMNTFEIDHSSISNGPAAKIYLNELFIEFPTDPNTTVNPRLLPIDCRLKKTNYSGRMVGLVKIETHHGIKGLLHLNFGEFPIMVKSKKCYLYKKKENQLIQMHEDDNEIGGYFISNGNERSIRMIIGVRKNRGMAIIRNIYTKRDFNYTKKAILFRGCREDQSSTTNILHYLSDGTITLEFLLRNGQFFIPVILILRCLKQCTDREIYEQITLGEEHDSFLSDRVEFMLRLAKQNNFIDRLWCLGFLGSKFRNILYLSKYRSDIKCGEYIIKHCIFVNCKAMVEKYYLCIHLIKKLYSLSDNKIHPENTDSLNTQEALLPGHLFVKILRERFLSFFGSLQFKINQDSEISPELVQFDNIKYLINVLKIVHQHIGNVGEHFSYLMNTGNLKSTLDLDLQQINGFTIFAERINYAKFISYFRAIHRGKKFTEMRITTVRKLLPSCWGFICPVHTPDGTPCGLLNHITLNCQVISHSLLTNESSGYLLSMLINLGLKKRIKFTPWDDVVVVTYNGIILGGIETFLAKRFCFNLRILKVSSSKTIPRVNLILLNLQHQVN